MAVSRKKKLQHATKRARPPSSVSAVWMMAFSALFLWGLVVTIKSWTFYPVSLDFIGHAFNTAAQVFSTSNLLRVIPRYLLAVGVFMLIALPALFWGRFAFQKSDKVFESLGEEIALSSGLGYIFLSTLIFLIGVGRQFNSWFLGGVLLLLTLSGWWGTRTEQKRWKESLRRIQWERFLFHPYGWLFSLFIFLAVMMSFVPEVFYDASVYHLGLPQLFVNEGAIVNTQNVYFSRFPLFMQMLYVPAVALAHSAAAKLVNVSVLLIGALGSNALCRRLGFPKAGPFAALLFISIPTVQLNVWTTAPDAAQAAYAVLLLLYWLTVREKEISWKNAFLLGLFSGSVFAIKYTGVVTCLMFLVILGASLIRKQSWKAVAMIILMYGGGTTLVMAPYLIRNVIWTGNPTYPILSRVFESQDIHQGKMDSETNIIGVDKPKNMREWLTFPWKATMQPPSSFNFAGPLMLALLPFVFFLPWRTNAGLMEAGCFVALYFLFHLNVTGSIRYLLAGLGLLGCLVACGVNHLAQKFPSQGKTTLFFSGVLLLWQWALAAQTSVEMYQPIPVLLGAESQTNYLMKMKNGLNQWPIASLFSDIKELPKEARVYVLGTEQVFGIPRRFWYSSVHDHTPLVLWANHSQNGDALHEKMQAGHFTHLLINLAEAYRLAGYNLFHWNDQGRAAFHDFAQRHLELIAVKDIEQAKGALLLFALKDRVDSPSPFFRVPLVRDILKLDKK